VMYIYIAVSRDVYDICTNYNVPCKGRCNDRTSEFVHVLSTRVRTHTHTHMCVCVCVRACTCTCMCDTHTHTYTNTYTRTVCVSVCVCVCVYVCVCLCVSPRARGRWGSASFVRGGVCGDLGLHPCFFFLRSRVASLFFFKSIFFMFIVYIQ
jgi:hypothetical protein